MEGYFASGYDRILVRGAIHYGLFVLADGHDGDFDNSEWTQLNPGGATVYLRDQYDSAVLQIRKPVRLLPRDGGFLQYQQLRDENADQAILATRLMSDPSGLLLHASGDSVLQRKLAFIQRSYSDWTNGQMNAQYWTDLKSGTVGERYFASL